MEDIQGIKNISSEKKVCHTCGMGIHRNCNCSHHKVVPLLVALFGLLFLLGNLGYVGANYVNIIWPVLALVGGLAKLFENNCRCC